MKLPRKRNFFLHSKVIRIMILTLIPLVILIFAFFGLNSTGSRIKQDAGIIYKACINKTDREECYAEEFYNLTKNNSFAYSLKVLTAVQGIDPNAIACHTIAHRMSEAEVEKNPSKWTDVVKKISFYDCDGGFLHGIVEGHSEQDPTFVINESAVDLICNQFSHTNFLFRNCVHGMGHLMLVQFKGNVNVAVEECRKLREESRFSCWAGVFMENLTRKFLVDHGVGFPFRWTIASSQKMESLCNTFSGLTQNACWQEISLMYIFIYHFNPNEIYKSCQKAPNTASKRACYVYGIAIMENYSGFNKQKLPTLCSVYDIGSPIYANCMTQVIRYLIYNNLKNVDAGIYTCTHIPDSVKNLCFNDLIASLTDVKASSSYIKKICTKAPKNFSNKVCGSI